MHASAAFLKQVVHLGPVWIFTAHACFFSCVFCLLKQLRTDDSWIDSLNAVFDRLFVGVVSNRVLKLSKLGSVVQYLPHVACRELCASRPRVARLIELGRNSRRPYALNVQLKGVKDPFELLLINLPFAVDLSV